MTTPRLGAPELVSGQATPETTVNEQVRYIESGAGHFIFKSRVVATPPGTPADGDCYLIAASPTGAWAAQAAKIAFRVNTAWAFITPIEGFTAWVNDENAFIGYDGAAWSTLASPSGVYQPLDADLTALAGLTSAANKVPYFTGSAAAALLTLDTDGTLAANSDTTLATQKAVKTYVGNAVTGLLELKGSQDCSANPNYPVALKGDSYVVSVSGKIGGASGTTVSAGDVFFATADNAGGTQASVGSSWDTIVHSGGTGSAIAAKDEGTTLTSGMTSINFVGAGVTATTSSGDVTVTVTGGGGGTSGAKAVPGGRLTLVTGTPVLTSDQTAKSIVYYTPYFGTDIPIYDGSAWSNQTFAELTLSLDATNHTSGSLYDVFVWNNAGTISIGTGPAWSSSTARGTGAGTTELQRLGGILTNKNSITLKNGAGAGTTGIAATTATYVGTIYCTANGQTGMAFKPARAAGGTNNILGVFNAYNRRRVSAVCRDSTRSWSVTAASFQSSDSSASNRISFVDGLGESSVEASYCVITTSSPSLSRGAVGIGFNVTSGTPTAIGYGSSSSSIECSSIVRDAFSPQLGFNFVQALESSLSGGTAATFFGSDSGGTVPWHHLVATLEI